ncbi:MAG TPA: hypothetical protein VH062_11285 [Polyangiaceae bacterium]|nr:hypothetical protein [Polyangiaceae bacterium]
MSLAVALSGCSASTGKNGGGGGGGFTGLPPASGSTPGTGNVANPGGFQSQGGNGTGLSGVTFDTGGSAGAGAVPGAGGGPPMMSDGHIGPPSTDTCMGDVAKFQSPAGAVKLLYPYDGTVFPRGLGAPLLMWDANVNADQILIQAASKNWTYTACPLTPDKVRFALDDNVWKGAASYSDGPADPLTVKITILSGGKVMGPITVSLKFALASLKGAIYYNTYGSMLANNNGAVLKLVPGDPQPTLFLTDNAVGTSGPCRSCHALSANGTTMTANHHTYPGVYLSESYDVTGPTPTLVFNNLPEAGFAGIFPDGSRLMTNGPPNPSLSIFFPTAPGDLTALVPSTSGMLDTKTGMPITANGWNIKHAQMPMFSPDGRHIVYNDYDQGPQSMVTTDNTMYTVGGHSLWTQDFDPGTNTFSNPKQIYSDPTLFPAWPFFTPDSTKVVFATDTRSDFASQVPDIFGPPMMTPTGAGHLVIIDLASGMVTALDAANGYANGMSYLPAGEMRDNNLEFFPTVSPISGGGFAWVLFTSRRTYGNLWTPGIDDPTSKKIWVTAVNIGLPAGTDPSAPAFLLPGQEIGSGNIRAFAALEPCKEDGQTCMSGSDCCKGFCSKIDPATGIGMCGKTVDHTCSRVDEKCTMDSDCCTDANNGALGRPLYCISTAGTAFCEQKSVN